MASIRNYIKNIFYTPKIKTNILYFYTNLQQIRKCMKKRIDIM